MIEEHATGIGCQPKRHSQFEVAAPRHFLLPAILLLLSEEPRHGYSLAKGVHAFNKMKYENAIELFDKAIEENPGSADLYRPRICPSADIWFYLIAHVELFRYLHQPLAHLRMVIRANRYGRPFAQLKMR